MHNTEYNIFFMWHISWHTLCLHHQSLVIFAAKISLDWQHRIQYANIKRNGAKSAQIAQKHVLILFAGCHLLADVISTVL